MIDARFRRDCATVTVHLLEPMASDERLELKTWCVRPRRKLRVSMRGSLRSSSVVKGKKMCPLALT